MLGCEDLEDISNCNKMTYFVKNHICYSYVHKEGKEILEIFDGGSLF